MKAIQDRLVEVELKAKEAAVSEKADSMHPDRLQAKLNSWVEKLETQVKQMEKKLSRKVKSLETTQSNLQEDLKKMPRGEKEKSNRLMISVQEETDTVDSSIGQLCGANEVTVNGLESA